MIEIFVHRTIVHFTDQNRISKAVYRISPVIVCKIGFTGWNAKIALCVRPWSLPTIFCFDTSELKQRSENSQRFYFDRGEVKQLSERSQRFYFSVTYASEIIFQWLVLKQRSNRSVISQLLNKTA